MHCRAFQRSSVLVKVPIRDAVLHRHHHRIRAKKLGHIARHRFHLVRFHGQNNHVLWPRGGIVVAGLHVAGNMLLPIVHDEFHTVLADRSQIGATHHERYIFPGQCQLNANIPANGACANDCNFHVDFP